MLRQQCCNVKHTTKTHVKPCDTTQHVSKQVICLCRLFVQLIVQDFYILVGKCPQLLVTVQTTE